MLETYRYRIPGLVLCQHAHRSRQQLPQKIEWLPSPSTSQCRMK
jgi:hypothetical protein